MNLRILQIYLFFSLIFFVHSLTSKNSSYMAQREIETYWKYYYNETDTSTFEPYQGTSTSYFSSTKGKSTLSTTKKLNEYYPDWMSGIVGTRRLDTLTIPGTHDTCARHGYPLFKCQDRTLEEQLFMGVRLIDIRCRHINDVFMIHHERSYQKQSFGHDVRDVCVTFLKNHPSEVIFMLIQEEWKPKDNTRTFEETMYSYIDCDEFKNYFYLYEGQLPTIDLVRGKIVLLRRFSKNKLSNVNMGNFIKFADNDFFVSNFDITVYGQDCYKVGNLFKRSKKYKKVESFFEKTRNVAPKILSDSTTTTLFLNFASAQSLYCYPYLVAEYVTPRIGKYIEKSFPNEFLGMIFFDFVNRYYPKILYNIIKRNFIPEKNGGLPDNFKICDPDHCTNKANGTNKLYVALVVIGVIVIFGLIVFLIVFFVIRYKRKRNQNMNSENEGSSGFSEKE